MFAQIVFGVGALAASPAMARRSGDLAGEGQTVLAAASSCPSLPASCQNTTQETNLCCFEGLGLIQQVQFWDTDTANGPSNSWTIHGLWPNYCDGEYPEDCDDTRDYSDITSLLESFGATDTLNYMNSYWLNDDGTSERLWAHEWSTHGTCYTTLQASCFSNYQTGEDAVAFYETVVALFKTLPTYDWLAQAGITPSYDQTYSLSELQNAIQNAAGVTATFDCEHDELYQIEYWFNVQGPVPGGNFIPIAAYDQGSCRSSGIKYLPKDEDGDDSRRERDRSRSRRRRDSRESRRRRRSVDTGRLADEV